MDAVDNTILLFEYGSKAHGTNTVDSDTDMMGIFVEPKEYVTGILHMDTQERKSAIRGERSTASDVDGVFYPLRKWAALAAKGNPTVLTAFFAPTYDVSTVSGMNLLLHKDDFISREAGERFLGYMISQRNAMLGLRNKKTNRPELAHKFGFDTKFGYHMLRLGLQGIELMATGKLELPMTTEFRSYLTGVREGKFTKSEVIEQSIELENDLREAIETSDLPIEPDVAKINAVLHEIYRAEWK